MKEEKEILRIYGVGEIPAEYVSVVLGRISNAYDGLTCLDFLANLTEGQIKSTRYLFTNTDFGISGKSFLLTQDSLIMKSVILQSPGSWEFLGKLNPLETIRQYLNDRHERKKDEIYRNDIERRILSLELIEKTVNVAKSAGMKESEIASMVRDYALIPLCNLESLQDSKMISHADFPNRKKYEIEDSQNT